MSAVRILIDTNVYFRLAQSVHPLLKRAFGSPPHQIYITDDLEKEFNKSSRLQLKFGWFNRSEYVENRKGTLSLSRVQKKQFQNDWDTVLGIANQLGYVDLSKEDINGIVYALLLEVTLVTDDIELADVAGQLGVKVISTLDLLKLMMDKDHIELKVAKSIALYWSQIADCPANLKENFFRLFGTDFTD